MLENQDSAGNQRIFVVTGEAIRDAWAGRIARLRAAIVTMGTWLTAAPEGPELTADEREDLASDIAHLERTVEIEEFARQHVAGGNIRMSRDELNDLQREAFRDHPATLLTFAKAVQNMRQNKLERALSDALKKNWGASYGGPDKPPQDTGSAPEPGQMGGLSENG